MIVESLFEEKEAWVGRLINEIIMNKGQTEKQNWPKGKGLARFFLEDWVLCNNIDAEGMTSYF